MDQDIKAQISYLKQADPVLKKLILANSLPDPHPEADIYLTLLRSVVGQQLSVKAAGTIFSRFLLLFPESYPDAESLLNLPDEPMRQAGLSGQKLSYLKAIAAYKLDGNLEPELITHLPDEALISHLTKIKGVGRWTAEMLLMFSMNRHDVFPIDDLGIRNAMIKQYGVIAEKKELKISLLQISEKWKPYRTLACKYLWKSLNNS